MANTAGATFKRSRLIVFCIHGNKWETASYMLLLATLMDSMYQREITYKIQIIFCTWGPESETDCFSLDLFSCGRGQENLLNISFCSTCNIVQTWWWQVVRYDFCFFYLTYSPSPAKTGPGYFRLETSKQYGFGLPCSSYITILQLHRCAFLMNNFDLSFMILHILD